MRETSVGCLQCAPYWGPGLQPRLCPDWELNGQPFGLQATTQYTELHQPGLLVAFYTSYIENTGWSSPIYVFSIISHWGVGISYFNIRDLFKVLGQITRFTYQEIDRFHPICRVSKYFFLEMELAQFGVSTQFSALMSFVSTVKDVFGEGGMVGVVASGCLGIEILLGNHTVLFRSA